MVLPSSPCSNSLTIPAALVGIVSPTLILPCFPPIVPREAGSSLQPKYFLQPVHTCRRSPNRAIPAGDNYCHHAKLWQNEQFLILRYERVKGKEYLLTIIGNL